MNNNLIGLMTDHSIGLSSITLTPTFFEELKKNFKSAAIADLGVFTNAYTFYEGCKKVGVKPILGISLKTPDGVVSVYIKNADGYTSLCKLVSEINSKGFDYKLLEDYKDGLLLVDVSCLETLNNLQAFNSIKLKAKEDEYKRLETRDSKSFKDSVSYRNSLSDSLDELKEEIDSVKAETHKASLKAFVKSLTEKGLDETDALIEQAKVLAELKERSESLKESQKAQKAKLSTLDKNLKLKESNFVYADSLKEEIEKLKSFNPEEGKKKAKELDSFFRKVFKEDYYTSCVDFQGEIILGKLFNSLEGEEEKLNSLVTIKAIQDGDYSYKQADFYPIKAISSQVLEDIASKCNFQFKTVNHLPKFDTGDKTSKELIRAICEDKIADSPKLQTSEVLARMEYELNVIDSMGFNDYLLMVADYCEMGRYFGKCTVEEIEFLGEKAFDKEFMKSFTEGKIGYGVGAGRGSGAGSIVCYLLGITELNPLKYDLYFERFLNPERVSLPDVDVDFNTEMGVYIEKYVRRKYGFECVSNITTVLTRVGRGSIKAYAKVYALKNNKNYKAYNDLADSISKDIASDEATLTEDVLASLRDKYQGVKEALDIIEGAVILEKTAVSTGIHPAGVIISDGNPVSEYTPLIKDGEILKSSCTMDYAEKICGLIKMDFLKLKTLNVITDTMRLIGKDVLSDISLEDERVYSEIFQKGLTNSVFQFESTGMKGMLKKFKPSCFEDLIILVALYRPGPMQYLADVIAVKNGGMKPNYLLPELEPILKSTYGAIVYQEQVMNIARTLAGYSLAQADILRKAIGKKKLDLILAEKQAFVYGDKERGIKGCKNNNIPTAKAEELFEQIVDFASYSFNKSHAAAYSLLSFYTAYLKLYYPKEFISVCIDLIDAPNMDKKGEKLSGLMSDAKKFGIKVLQPDIFKSDVSSKPEGEAIRIGLKNIKSLKKDAIKAKALVENREVNSIDDLEISPAFAKKLILSGALDSLGEREELYNYLVLTKLETPFSDFDIQTEGYKSYDMKALEKDFLGVSFNNPLKEKPNSVDTDICAIADNVGATIYGRVNRIREKLDKNGRTYAFVELEDETESIGVVFFSSLWLKKKTFIKEGITLCVKGVGNLYNGKMSFVAKDSEQVF